MLGGTGRFAGVLGVAFESAAATNTTRLPDGSNAHNLRFEFHLRCWGGGWGMRSPTHRGGSSMLANALVCATLPTTDLGRATVPAGLATAAGPLPWTPASSRRDSAERATLRP
jgi:hypothetical protein